MADGLKFRRSIDGDAVIPVIDVIASDAYWATAKPGDLVTQSATTGEVSASAVTVKTHYGVVVGKEYIRETGDPKIVKVRVSKNAVYEADVSAGTPVAGVAYEITTDFRVDASKTTNASVKVLKVLPGSKVLVTVL